MRVTRELVLEIDRHEVNVGESVTVRVHDRANRPIEGATVVAGSTRRRTDARGLCTITFDTPGFQKLVARKAPTERVAYKRATGLVRAVPRAASRRPTRRTGPPTL